jgi:hypothetical protein
MNSPVFDRAAAASLVSAYTCQFLVEAGKLDAADRVVELLGRDSLVSHSNTTFAYHYAAGCVALARGQARSAFYHFEKAAVRSPRKEEYAVLFMLARAHLEVGNHVGAVQLFEELVYSADHGRYVRFFAWDSRVRYYLGRAYEASNQVARAIEQYNTIIHVWQDGDQDLSPLILARERLDELSHHN